MILVSFKCSAPECPREVSFRVQSEWYFNKARLPDIKPRGWRIRVPIGQLALAYCPQHAEGAVRE